VVLKSPYHYPSSQLDLPEYLLTVVGSYWAQTHDNVTLVSSLLHARAQLDAQAHNDLAELIDSISRFSVPILHRENWYVLTFRESQLNTTVLNMPRYDGTYRFKADNQFNYGVPISTPLFCFDIPAELTDFTVLLNRISAASLSLVRGIDFEVRDSVIAFTANPFDNELVPKQNVYDGNDIVDREITFWVYRGQFDRETIYQQFGYVLNTRLPSSRAYRDFLNMIFDGLVEGTTARNVEGALAAICDVPLVKADGEVVKYLLPDRRSYWIVTDQNAYAVHLDSTITVAVGDVLKQGQTLTDTLKFYEFNRGQVPTDIAALSLGRGVLASGYYQDLVFENKTVALEVTTDDDGRTRVEFEVQGLPGDVIQFWDEVHARGTADGEQTLAQLLDRRTNPNGEPTALNLPTTINPFGFLCQNILRNNAALVKVKTSLVGPHALGMHNARLLRKLIPAHTMLLVLTEISAADEIVMDQAGDEQTPGYEEDVRIYLGASISEEMEADDYIDERVRAFQITGRCE
jgi:hypothetical protein